jgi:NADPH:quinone reductase-like Zn-dependent oxidoreductase
MTRRKRSASPVSPRLVEYAGGGAEYSSRGARRLGADPTAIQADSVTLASSAAMAVVSFMFQVPSFRPAKNRELDDNLILTEVSSPVGTKSH